VIQRFFILWVLLLTALAARCQTTVTIPAYSITVPLVINGTTINLTVPVPAQSFTVPAATLPTGLTYSASNGLSVTGPITSTGLITGTQVSLTGGTAPAPSSTGYYVLQLNSGAYTLVPFPVTVASQPATPPNAITITP
jgi:hypothetical protein